MSEREAKGAASWDVKISIIIRKTLSSKLVNASLLQVLVLQPASHHKQIAQGINPESILWSYNSRITCQDLEDTEMSVSKLASISKFWWINTASQMLQPLQILQRINSDRASASALPLSQQDCMPGPAKVCDRWCVHQELQQCIWPRKRNAGCGALVTWYSIESTDWWGMHRRA